MVNRRTPIPRSPHLLGFVLLCAASYIPLGSLADETGNRLIPVDPFSEIADGADYKTLYEQKLFVTKGDLARFVYLPGSGGAERVAAVYSSSEKQASLPASYWVTATEASGKLLHCISVPGQTERPVDPRTIKIRRDDAPLPESTAKVIHQFWLAMLLGRRPLSQEVLRGDSMTLIFSAADSRGRLLRAQADTVKGNTKRLWEIGESLFDYCRLPASQRAGAARELEERTRRLLKTSKAD